MLVSSSVMSHVPAAYSKLHFDMERDFVPVSKVYEVPLVIVMHLSVPARTTKELVALAKARPGELRLAIGGTGTTSHLVTELFALATGIRVPSCRTRVRVRRWSICSVGMSTGASIRYRRR